MSKFILNYNADPEFHLNGGAIPEHMHDALENYLFRGWNPGGFLTAVLAGDLFNAVWKADGDFTEAEEKVARLALRRSARFRSC